MGPIASMASGTFPRKIMVRRLLELAMAVAALEREWGDAAELHERQRDREQRDHRNDRDRREDQGHNQPRFLKNQIWNPTPTAKSPHSTQNAHASSRNGMPPTFTPRSAQTKPSGRNTAVIIESM